MLYTTKLLLHAHHACADGYKRFFSCRPPIADDEPIALVDILDVNGFDDALWCLRATTTPSRRLARFLAADLAEHVLPLFEAKCPDNPAPRHAIEATRDEATSAIDAAYAAHDAFAAGYDAAIAQDAAYAARAAAFAVYTARGTDDAYAARAIVNAAYAARDAAREVDRDAAAVDRERQWQTERFRAALIADTREISTKTRPKDRAKKEKPNGPKRKNRKASKSNLRSGSASRTR